MRGLVGARLTGAVAAAAPVASAAGGGFGSAISCASVSEQVRRESSHVGGVAQLGAGTVCVGPEVTKMQFWC